MARYILIDNCSGFIWGDTADVAGRSLPLGTSDEDIIAACGAIDDDAGVDQRHYEIISHSNPAALASNQTGYHVYRGSEQVMVAADGQDQEAIDAVTTYCELVAVVKCSRPEVGEEYRLRRLAAGDTNAALETNETFLQAASERPSLFSAISAFQIRRTAHPSQRARQGARRLTTSN